MTIAELPPEVPQEQALVVTSGVVTLAWPANYDSIYVLGYERVNATPERPKQYSVDVNAQTLNFFADDEGQTVVVRYWPSPMPGVTVPKVNELVDGVNAGGGGGGTLTRATAEGTFIADGYGQLNIVMPTLDTPKLVVGFWGWDEVYNYMTHYSQDLRMTITSELKATLEAVGGPPAVDAGIVTMQGTAVSGKLNHGQPGNPVHVWMDYFY